MCDFYVNEGLGASLRDTEPSKKLIAALTGEPELEIRFHYYLGANRGAVGSNPGDVHVTVRGAPWTTAAEGVNYRKLIGEFRLQPLPHSKVVLSASCWVGPDFRRKGLGGMFLRWRMKAALRCIDDIGSLDRRAVYTLLATVRDDNEKERNLLLAHGWENLGPVEPGVSSLWRVNP